MATPEYMQAAVQAYFDLFNAKDAEGIADLYAENATVEDPVGTPIKNGKAEILAFYQGALQSGSTLEKKGATRIASGFAAFAFTVHVGGSKGVAKMTIDVIDTFGFDDDGKVTEMRAFWGPTNLTKL